MTVIFELQVVPCGGKLDGCMVTLSFSRLPPPPPWLCRSGLWSGQSWEPYRHVKAGVVKVVYFTVKVEVAVVEDGDFMAMVVEDKDIMAAVVKGKDFMFKANILRQELKMTLYDLSVTLGPIELGL